MGKSKKSEEWEDVSAFSDLFDVEAVCESLREVASVEPEFRWDADCLTGEDSPLSIQLVKQANYAERVLEAERPGLYRRTWMESVFAELFVMLDEVTEFPSRLAERLPIIEIDLYKVLIAAHEVFDPVHRAKLVARAEQAEKDKEKAEQEARDGIEQAKKDSIELAEKAMRKGFEEGLVTAKSKLQSEYAKKNRRRGNGNGRDNGKGKDFVEKFKAYSRKRTYVAAWDSLASSIDDSFSGFCIDSVSDDGASIFYSYASRRREIKKSTFIRYWNEYVKNTSKKS